MTDRTAAAGYDLNDRRRDFIHALVAGLVSAHKPKRDEFFQINIRQARLYAEYSTVLKDPAAFEPMTQRQEMTFLNRRTASRDYGLLDGEQVPRWLLNVVRDARK